MPKELILDVLLRRKERLTRLAADTARRLAAIEKELGALHMRRNPAIEAVPSAMQRKVWACVMEGLGDKEIGARLNTSTSNVKQHLAALRKKTGCKDRKELYTCGLRRRRR